MEKISQSLGVLHISPCEWMCVCLCACTHTRERERTKCRFQKLGKPTLRNVLNGWERGTGENWRQIGSSALTSFPWACFPKRSLASIFPLPQMFTQVLQRSPPSLKVAASWPCYESLGSTDALERAFTLVLQSHSFIINCSFDDLPVSTFWLFHIIL